VCVKYHGYCAATDMGEDLRRGAMGSHDANDHRSRRNQCRTQRMLNAAAKNMGNSSSEWLGGITNMMGKDESAKGPAEQKLVCPLLSLRPRTLDDSARCMDRRRKYLLVAIVGWFMMR